MKKLFGLFTWIFCWLFGLLMVNAATLNEADISAGDGKIQYFYWVKPASGNVFERYDRLKNYTVSDGDDDFVAYCIEPFVDTSLDYDYIKGSWENTDIPSNIRNKISLIAYYGYGYTGHNTQDYRSATQALIWENILRTNFDSSYKVIYKSNFAGYGNDFNSGIVYDVDDEKNEINYLVNHHVDVPSFDGGDFSSGVGDEIVLHDDNGVLSNYEVLDSDGALVSIDGNNLSITPTSLGISEIKFVKKQLYDSSYFVYYSDDYQNMLTRGNVEPVYFSVSLSGTGSAKVVKRDYDSGMVIGRPNIMFKVFDVDNDVFVMNGDSDVFYTNDEGYFVVSGLSSGNYRVMEVDQDLDGFVWNDSYLDFTFDESCMSDGIYEVDFYNKAVVGSVEISKTGG